MEAVLANLRAAIENGEFAVGAKLPAETALARRYTVSRSVIREALRALQAIGMTVSRTGKGTFVQADRAVENPTFGSYSARDLLEVRLHVEIPVSGYAADRRTEDDLDALGDLLDRMASEADDTDWAALDTLFHITVAQASGNPVFRRVIEEIRDALARQSTFVNQIHGRREQSDTEHRRIVDAIAGRDPDRARKAMRAHLEKVDTSLNAIVLRVPPQPARASEGADTGPDQRPSAGPKTFPL
ncbi:FadR/GntR family transcriptional regulator [Actinorugispora endophytica]|uniref:DNA-binding FadR family transcriptional regulator n=1 Tax=Actinorugispora endophytica TaxID=1605990 RepID=A0A4R6V4B6_9ACTN|nr:FadR/GntR family transcriptional regulator [Actinorugispora endophytica]TDQ53059.1 DNA-binding FadR family transcriptional regulator [Actinorugispora endophytica]